MERLVASLLLWAGLVLVFLFYLRAVPQTGPAWLFTVTLGPLLLIGLSVMAEASVEALRNAPGVRAVRDRVTEASRGVSFSWLRIGYLLVEILVFLAALLGLGWLVWQLGGTGSQWLQDLFERHFNYSWGAA